MGVIVLKEEAAEGKGERAGGMLTGQVVSNFSCTAVQSLGTPMPYMPHCWSTDASAQMETALVGKASGAPTGMFGHPLLARKDVRQGTVAETARMSQPKGMLQLMVRAAWSTASARGVAVSVAKVRWQTAGALSHDSAA